jgi:hypothetical protein
MDLKKQLTANVCAVLIFSFVAAAQINGSGTANHVPKFTGSSTVGDSAITELNGNIGIGQPNPSRTLDVNGDIRISGGGWGFRLNPVAGELRLRNDQDTGQLQMHVGSLISDSNIGLTTTSPSGLLANTNRNPLDYSSNGVTAGALVWSANSGNTGHAVTFENQGIGTRRDVLSLVGADTSANSYLLDVDSGGASRFLVRSDGNIGIGTTSPSQRLEVNGNFKFTQGSAGSITFSDGTTQSTAWNGTLCGGDYAESVDVSGDRIRYEPGDVLEIDPLNPEHFIKSSEPYSTAVAGIYSTKPGMIGRRSTDQKKAKEEIPMAMIGIVPLKVSSENGPIHPRDLLVTSSTPGYAMKGTDRSRLTGAIVGKALGTLDHGNGVINALVSLQ